MNKTKLYCFIMVAFLMGISPLFGADKPVNVQNNSFENTGSSGEPLHWDASISGGGKGAIAVVDNRQTHSARNSLRFSLPQWGQGVAVSQLVTLKVGHLYRLSGWVKTESVRTQAIDRYPTSAAACLTMESFPFTNHSPTLGATSDWQKVEIQFIALRSKDRVQLHLGLNGNAVGNAWFDDIKLEEIDDITSYIPMETVKWFGPAYRYDDKGWIFVHIEGKPYERGYQYGYLVGKDIQAYIGKLAYEMYPEKPGEGWYHLTKFADSLMLRKYEPEYLEEMKGIADGAAKAGATFDGRPLTLLDIVTMNSAIDIEQMYRGLYRTGHALTGRSFLKAEEELNIPTKTHKCSGFLANGPATPDGGIVFGQIFMWSGYTGVHWNVICDIIPHKGNRLVYQTYPGGIHSGADFYMNSAGMMMGETTVSQTPFNVDGTPQSNRIRKAAQYANSIDDAVKILSYKNNGMYTNDWLMGDAKTNETAIFLLGTYKTKLWRSSTGEFPAGFKGFYWSNNNNKDPEVRKEYIPHPENAPYDLVFSPWNRDISFNEFFRKNNGKIDHNAGVRLWASAPINRPHACDGKITTTEMAKNMVFLAHFGKVTLREKIPAKDHRLMPDLPGATPHLSLGYSVASPVFITEKLKALKKEQEKETQKASKNVSDVKDFYSFKKSLLWHNTVYPASPKENWFISATAAYWRMMRYLPSSPEKAALKLRDNLADNNYQLLYVTSREGTLKPLETKRAYDEYKFYRLPRIRGTFLLHQLRLKLGNDVFSKLMNDIHTRFREKKMSYKHFIAAAEKVSKMKLKKFILQWLEREDLPQPVPTATATKKGDEWEIVLKVKQPQDKFYSFVTMVGLDCGNKELWKKIDVTAADQEFRFMVKEKPSGLSFNVGNDIPVDQENFYIFSNYYDDFHHTKIVYGTSRQIEAGHTLALRFSEALADRYSEVLPPVIKDGEVTEDELKNNDLFILGNPADNSLMGKITKELNLEVGKNFFHWQGKTYGAPDDGLVAVYPNPYNSKKVVYLVIANSALQLYEMTKKIHRLKAWAIFKGDKRKSQGYHPVKRFKIQI